MTWNIKGQAAFFSRSHVDEIARAIRDASPDLVGLQEVHRRRWQSRGRDQAADLAAATGLNLFFGRSLGNDNREYGNAILTRGAIVDARVEALPGGGEPRSLLASTIELGGLRMHAFVTHFAAWGRFGRKNRLLQSEAVVKIAEQSTLPFVLMGDFNSDPSGEELRVFLEGKLVSSCFPADVITHRATRKCLDYVFADPAWQVRDARVLQLGPSDHWPLVAELERA
jgi:endonuclease/exonuclease/phosphatase family metal-dependent hydrolase